MCAIKETLWHRKSKIECDPAHIICMLKLLKGEIKEKNNSEVVLSCKILTNLVKFSHLLRKKAPPINFHNWKYNIWKYLIKMIYLIQNGTFQKNILPFSHNRDNCYSTKTISDWIFQKDTSQIWPIFTILTRFGFFLVQKQSPE